MNTKRERRRETDRCKGETDRHKERLTERDEQKGAGG